MFEGLEMTQVGKMSAGEPTRVELGEEGVACDSKEFRIAEGNSTRSHLLCYPVTKCL